MIVITLDLLNNNYPCHNHLWIYNRQKKTGEKLDKHLLFIEEIETKDKI